MREPEYIALDTRAAQSIKRLSKGERLSFFDRILKDYERLTNGERIENYPDTLTGDLMKQQAGTMERVYNAYMKRVNANPSGLAKEPKGEPNGVPNGYPMGVNQINHNQNQDNHNQSNPIKQAGRPEGEQTARAALIREGYTKAEIDNAMAAAEGQKGVKDLAAYARRIIQNARKAGKTVSAQQYSQRDYSGQEETTDDMITRLTMADFVDKLREQHTESEVKSAVLTIMAREPEKRIIDIDLSEITNEISSRQGAKE